MSFCNAPARQTWVQCSRCNHTESCRLYAVEVDPKLPGPDVTPIPASQQLFNEAKYYMFAREDWPVAAELLRHLLPDGNKGLPKGIDWPPLMKLLRTIKDGLIRSGEDTWDSFPYYRIALQVRGTSKHSMFGRVFLSLFRRSL